MGSLLPSNTFGGRGIEMFTPVGGAEPDFDVIVQGNLTVSGQEVLLPTADLVMTAGTIRGNDAVLTGPLSCTNLTATGPLTGTTAKFTGELQCDSLVADGGLQITELACELAQVFTTITAGGIVTAGGLIAGNSTITGNLIVEGTLSVTGGIPVPIPDVAAGIAPVVPRANPGVLATVPFPTITANSVVLITLNTPQPELFFNLCFSVNVQPGVGFTIGGSSGIGAGVPASFSWTIARL